MTKVSIDILLPDPNKSKFGIIKCDINYSFNKNLEKVEQTIAYTLKKIVDSNSNNWQEVFKTSISDFELISVHNSRNEHLKATRKLSNEKIAYTIDLGDDIKVGDYIELKIKTIQRAPIIAVEKGLLYRRSIIYFNKTFSNYCDSLIVNFEFIKNKYIYSLKSKPFSIKPFEFEITDLRPHEFFSIVIYTHSGMISKMFSQFTSLLLLLFLGALISQLFELIFS